MLMDHCWSIKLELECPSGTLNFYKANVLILLPPKCVQGIRLCSYSLYHGFSFWGFKDVTWGHVEWVRHNSLPYLNIFPAWKLTDLVCFLTSFHLIFLHLFISSDYPPSFRPRLGDGRTPKREEGHPCPRVQECEDDERICVGFLVKTMNLGYIGDWTSRWSCDTILPLWLINWGESWDSFSFCLVSFHKDFLTWKPSCLKLPPELHPAKTHKSTL